METKNVAQTILVVEDNTANLEVIIAYLKEAGFGILEARKGEDGLTRARRGRPDLILLDILMPGIDGFEVCRRLKSDEATRNIPVIFMTALAEMEHKVKGLHLGAVDYITKPIQKEELLARISTQLRLRELTERLEQKIEERTLELTTTNEQLLAKIAERGWAEEALRESEERFRAVVETANDAIITIDSRGKIVAWNNGAQVMFGYSIDEINGQSLTPILPERYRAGHQSGLRRVVSGGEKKVIGTTVELTGLRKEGSEFPLELSLAAWKSGEELFFTAIIRDITGRVQAEEALAEKSMYLDNILRSATEYAIATTDLDFRITYYNPLAEQFFGYTAAEVIGKTVQEIHIREQVASERFEKAVENVRVHGEYRYRVVQEGDNGTRYLNSRVSGIYNPDGELVGFALFSRDVTMQVKAKEALRKSEERLSKFINSAENSYHILDADFKILEINRGALEAIYSANPAINSKEDVVGQNFEQFYPFLIDEMPHFSKVIKTGTKYANELTVPHPKIGDLTVSFICFKVGQNLGIIAEDITERKRAEESLRQLNQAIEQSPVSVMIADTEGIIQYVNPKFSQVTGYSAEEAVGQNPHILQSGYHPPAFYRELWATLTAGQEWRGEFHNRKKNGELYWELASIAGVKDQSGKITHYVGVKEDITQRKQMEEEMVQQERLAAVGQLAAGIAHDFNNILTGILGFAELLQMSPNMSESDRYDLARISKQSQRAAHLVRQILDFSRKSIRRPQQLDLIPFLKESVKFLKRTIPENILMSLEIEPVEFLVVKADPAQLQQALTNLVVNARDAMPEGGALKLRLSHFTLIPEMQTPYPEMLPGEWAAFSVTDTGAGIPTETLPHIFEPFFTTKEVGQGTGLGLAQVYGIVRQHEGYIDVTTSRTGQETTFTVYLPTLTVKEKSSKKETLPKIPQGQGETILLVEDEPAVLEVFQVTLERLGYRVLPATNGEEALLVYAEHKEQIALVLADMVMPRLDGVQLFEALRAQDPKIKMVMTSGYPLGEETRQPLPEGLVDWLLKPITPAQLAHIMRRALR